ncbi:MAG: DNA polymerase I [Gammaproteobacteria bacterium]|nr:DNA polymerase I [Gammaproteobacteria bacterium]
MAERTLILVDASGYVFRTHYALVNQGLTSPDGQATHIIMGVLNMLDRLQNQYADASIIMVFDGKGPGVRAEWASDYKENRPLTPQDIKSQIPPLQEIIRARGTPLAVEENTEADDIIATLVKQAKQDDKSKKSYQKIIVASGDKDLAQLVDEQVSMLYDDKNNILWDIAGVTEKYGVPPRLIPDYLSLIGDKVDNIHGVDKVGPKTATAWLNEYDSLQGVMDNSDKIDGKVGENLRAALSYLPLSLKMNTLISDIPLSASLAELERKEPDTDKLMKLYTKFGLKKFIKGMQDLDVPRPATTISSKVIGGDNPEEWSKMLQLLQGQETFALSLILSDSDFMVAELVGIAFAVQDDSGFYVPCGHDYAGATAQLKADDILQDLLPLLTAADKRKVGHNTKMIAHLLANKHQVSDKDCDAMLDSSDDLMIISYINNSAEKHDLVSLSAKYLKQDKQDLEDLTGKGKSRIPLNLLDINKVGAYAAEEAALCFQLQKALSGQLQKENTLQQVYEKIDLPLVKLLRQAERQGALLDTKILAKQSKGLEAEMLKLQQKAFKLAGTEFNINSPSQLKEILYNKMGFSTKAKTSGGQASTAEHVLVELAKEHEFPGLILEYRSVSKLKNTYTDALPLLVNPDTKRLHTSFNQAVASTGRLSSVNPNLQNIPMRTEAGRNVRAAFTAPAGMVIAAADYSQVELRIMAQLSGDAALVEAFEAGQDVHAATAAEIFDIPLDKVDRDQRRRAKIINFGLIYGMGPFGLAKQLGISNKEGQDFVALYFLRYPGVLQYMEDVRATATKQGWAATLSGRRVYLPQINSDNFIAKQAAVRAAINAPVQGSAADLIKLAMIKLQPQLKQGEAHMILQVHDELVFEIREDLVDKYKKIIKQTMESATPLSGSMKVPLIADFSYGKNWKEAH